VLALFVNDLEKANLYNEARQVAEMIEGIKAFIQRHTEPFPESATLHTD
jgi:hypothetical protein